MWPTLRRGFGWLFWMRDRGRLGRGRGFFLCWVILWLWPVAAAAELRTAEILVRDQPQRPQDDDRDWRAVTLPHALFDDDRRATGAWFRFRLATPTWLDEPALYVYWANENAAFYLNGSFVGDGGKAQRSDCAPLERAVLRAAARALASR